MCSHHRQTMLFSATMTDEVGRGEWRNSTESPGLGWAGAASPSRPLFQKTEHAQLSPPPALGSLLLHLRPPPWDLRDSWTTGWPPWGKPGDGATGKGAQALVTSSWDPTLGLRSGNQGASLNACLSVSPALSPSLGASWSL